MHGRVRILSVPYGPSLVLGLVNPDGSFRASGTIESATSRRGYISTAATLKKELGPRDRLGPLTGLLRTSTGYQPFYIVRTRKARVRTAVTMPSRYGLSISHGSHGKSGHLSPIPMVDGNVDSQVPEALTEPSGFTKLEPN